LLLARLTIACLAVFPAGCAGFGARDIAAPTGYTQERVAPDFPASPEYAAFLAAGVPDAVIPGLTQDFVPQGLAFDSARNWILVTGYRADGRPSMLFVIDAETRRMSGKAVFELPDGALYSGHAGGIAILGNDAYISSETRVYRFSMAGLGKAIASAGVPGVEPGVVRFIDFMTTPTRASFCSAAAGVLWVGDFEYGAAYPTGDFRHMKARDGSDHRAWIAGYTLEPGATLAGRPVDSRGFAIPDSILSVGDRIQGMAVVPGGTIILSRSFGRNNPSSLLVYVDPTSGAPHARVGLGGADVPLWFLDGLQKRKTMMAPPMSEGLAEAGGRVLVLFESGAAVYRSAAGRAPYPIDRIWTLDPALLLQ
jgi:hypothetical protein